MKLRLDLLNQRIKESLAEAGHILFPNNDMSDSLIKPHVWRDRKYLGELNGNVNSWKGWSLNLSLLDPRYRVIFIDVVDNILPPEENQRLFGDEFANYIANMKRFVVILVTDFPLNTLETIKHQGFIPRTMQRSNHACAIADEEEFLQMPSFYWAAKVAKLVQLQRSLSVHRKPLDSGEIPLQHLLYRTGYLHQYVVESGLGIHHFSRPRKAGEFGHDFHLEVSNPYINNGKPFSLGIEIYVTSMGYHIETIPAYANQFGLGGMIVVSKDNPHPLLTSVKDKFQREFHKMPLKHMGEDHIIGIHHLPLTGIVMDLLNLKNTLEEML